MTESKNSIVEKLRPHSAMMSAMTDKHWQVEDFESLHKDDVEAWLAMEKIANIISPPPMDKNTWFITDGGDELVAIASVCNYLFLSDEATDKIGRAASQLYWIDTPIRHSLIEIAIQSGIGSSLWRLMRHLPWIMLKSSHVMANATFEQALDLVSSPHFDDEIPEMSFADFAAGWASQEGTPRPRDQVEKVAKCIKWDRVNAFHQTDEFAKSFAESGIAALVPESVVCLVSSMNDVKLHLHNLAVSDPRSGPSVLDGVWRSTRYGGEVGESCVKFICLDKSPKDVWFRPSANIGWAIKNRPDVSIVITLHFLGFEQAGEVFLSKSLPGRIVIETGCDANSVTPTWDFDPPWQNFKTHFIKCRRKPLDGDYRISITIECIL